MKKLNFKHFVGAGLILSSLMFLGCPSQSSDSAPVKEEVKSTNVAVPDSVKSTTEYKEPTEENLKSLTTLISNKAIFRWFSDIVVPQNSTRAESTSTEGKVEEISKRISDSITKFQNDLSTGSAELNISEKPGTIADFADEGITAEIPYLRANVKITADQKTGAMSVTSNAGLSFSSYVDLTKTYETNETLTEEDKIIKAIYFDGLFSENANFSVTMSGDLPNVTGNASVNAATGAGVVFVIPDTNGDIAGKIVVNVNGNANVNDEKLKTISETFSTSADNVTFEKVKPILKECLNSVKLTIDVYSLNDKLIFNYKTVDTVDELITFIDEIVSTEV